MDSYIKSAKIYNDLGNEIKEKETLLEFFTRTEKIKNFILVSTNTRDELFQIIKKHAQKDSQFTFEVLEKTENLVGKKMFEVFDWEQRRGILIILKNLELDEITKEQKVKHLFWMSALSYHDEKDENLAQIEGWLEEAIKYNPTNNEYKEFLKNVTLLRKAKKDFNSGMFTKAIISLEEIIKDENINQAAFYKKLFYSRAFDLLGKSYAAEDMSRFHQNAFENWEKALELDPWNENYYLQLARNYLDLKDKAKARQVLEKCGQMLNNQKECQKLLKLTVDYGKNN